MNRWPPPVTSKHVKKVRKASAPKLRGKVLRAYRAALEEESSGNKSKSAVVSREEARKQEYHQIADRLRDLAIAAGREDIQAELKWLADSYDRLAERLEGDEDRLRAKPRDAIRLIEALKSA